MTRPSASYTPLLAAYVAVVATLVGVARRVRGPDLPQPTSSDVVLLGVATFKLSRLLTKEKVTQPLREPFVERTEPGDGSEVNCEPAGTGIRRSVGELLTCPFCISVWFATAFTAVFSMAPRVARLVAGGLTAAVVADVSQYAYAGARKAAS